MLKLEDSLVKQFVNGWKLYTFLNSTGATLV